MTARDIEILAAKILQEAFYDEDEVVVEGEPRVVLGIRKKDGKFVPTWACSFLLLQERRNLLLPPDFKFTFPLLPKGARYV